jgi:hypothetical protein
LEKKQTDAFRTTQNIDGFQYRTETGIAGGTIGLQFFATSEGYFDFVNNPSLPQDFIVWHIKKNPRKMRGFFFI